VSAVGLKRADFIGDRLCVSPFVALLPHRCGERLAAARAEPTVGVVPRSNIPARLDRLAWGRFHWRLLGALGVAWLFDGLEITLVGALGPALQGSSRLHLSATEVGMTASAYLIGSILGALIFGALADRLGRRLLFRVTLSIYLLATVATGLAWDFWSFAAFRLLTGTGIGGEGAAIGSAILEFTPARCRGRVHLFIASTYWLGAVLGALVTVPLLTPGLVAADLGWRLAFILGATLALIVLYLRRFLPESPRWLVAHGQYAQADAIVAGIEADTPVYDVENAAALASDDNSYEPDPGLSLTAYWASLRDIVFVEYRSRTLLNVILISTQAFFYNAIFFTYALILHDYLDVPASETPIYIIALAIGNLLGPLLFGRLFDTLGRTTMITSTYACSGLLMFGTAWLFSHGQLGAVTQTIAWTITFLFASAGASGAYLRVAEGFPIDIRAGAIALFYSVGTLLGGVAAPWFFGRLIQSGDRGEIVVGYSIAASLMLLGAVADLILGFKAAGLPLEQVAPPLRSTATDQRRR
jgi:MFS family permease